MAGVDETQLAKWSNKGPQTTAETTYTSIKTALSRADNLKKYAFEVYLQGSYGNKTNIIGNSDVDVVVELTSAYYPGLSRLPVAEKAEYDRQRTGSPFTFAGFRDDVQSVLTSYYGAGLVKARNKCIAVDAASGRLESDVIPCLTHKLFTKFSALKQESFDGIEFLTRDKSREVVNFPKRHTANGNAKTARATNYKATIRILKNWRDRLIAEETLKENVAPSYFIECLAWNIPDAAFIANKWQTIILACLKSLQGSDRTKFMCQNNVIELFGDTPEQWDTASALTFINSLIADWNKGR